MKIDLFTFAVGFAVTFALGVIASLIETGGFNGMAFIGAVSVAGGVLASQMLPSA